MAYRKGGRKKHSKGYVLVLQHGHPRADPNGYVYEHILVAEKILGRALKPGEEIHHVGAKDDQTQIVICRSCKFHNIIHQRLRAMEACGHYGWRKCVHCKQYDEPTNLYIYGTKVYHKKCQRIYKQKWYQKRRSNNGDCRNR